MVCLDFITIISVLMVINLIVYYTGNNLVLAPPTDECFECESKLSVNHTSLVKVYSLETTTMARKVTLRCKKCNLYYNISMYGNKSDDGFCYYDTPQNYIEVSDTVCFQRKLVEFQCSLA